MRPHRHHPNKVPNRGLKLSDGNSFVTSYTSLIIILLSFFIFLNSQTRPSLLSKNSVLSSITEAFSLNTKQSHFPPITNFNPIESIEKIAIENNISVEQNEKSSAVNLELSILFANDTSQINSDALPYLYELIEVARKNDLHISVLVKTEQNESWNSSLEYAGSIFRLFVDNKFEDEKLFISAKNTNASEEGVLIKFSESPFAEMRYDS